jgi:glutamyl-tRNA(Gln) amidotransferase subunit E
MSDKFDPKKNYEQTGKLIGYVPRKEANAGVYERLGFKSGLEIHQQLKTEKKLFCRCPAGIYQKDGKYDAEVIRHMRPTLSELGEYDGTALMEFKTRKNIIYRIKNETACTYDIDDTPPFRLNEESLKIGLEIALLLKTNIVGELHITRKQYLDGSIPTGFQRTGILGIEGEIPLRHKKVRIIQISLEEDSCREVSDIGHQRTYTTDRLGMPLTETVTYPDMKTPDEVAEAGHYLRFLTRSTGKVRTGIGAARQDVNVSVEGGRRVEIKGVAHIQRIPELTHNEAFRQRALLEIRQELKARIREPEKWNIASQPLPFDLLQPGKLPFKYLQDDFHRGLRVTAVNLPQFKGLLSFFTQPGRCFADELEGRVKVVACLGLPNMTHSEALTPRLDERDWAVVKKLLQSGDNDAQLICWGPSADMATALETIEERCRLAMEGVPNETRQALKDGTTVFERVLPGPDRMYPDTDSPPIPIEDRLIEEVRQCLPSEVADRVNRMKQWGIPADTYTYILRRNLFPLIERIVNDFAECPVFVGTLIGHSLRHIEGQMPRDDGFRYDKIYDLFRFKGQRDLEREILPLMLPVIYQHPQMDFESVLVTIDYQKQTEAEILSHLPVLRQKFKEINTSKDPTAEVRWIMGQLRPLALGNMPMEKLEKLVPGGAQ